MNLISVILVALKRLWNNKGLTLCSIVGLTTAVALISSVPLYTDAANFQVLKQRLSRAEGDGGRPRPAFAFMYRYIGAWHGAIEMDDYAPVNEYLTRSVPGLIGLPLETSTRHVKTDNFSLFPAADASYIGIRQPLGWVSLGFIQDVEQHIHVVDGEFPTLDMESDVISVLVSQAFSNETGVQVGEDYVVFRRDDSGDQVRQVQITLRIGGIWEPIDASHPFWFYNPDTMNSVFLVPEETFRLRLAPQMRGEIYAAIWYMVFDGDHVRTDDVPGLLGRVRYANTRVSALLPNTTLDVSPVDALENYRWTTFVMTIVLYVFAAPILGLVLYFIGMISGMVVERQRGEIAILKSRGAGDLQMVGIYALEGTLIGLIGLGFGLLAGRYLAGVMGNTISFLTFGERQPLHVLVTPRAVRFALVGVAVGMLASLWPAMRAARLTIVTYKHERARDMERPLWQRYFLDLLLLIPAGYGYYVLSNRGTIAILGGGNGDPFQDPLLFLVPSVTILAISLLFIRFFPLLMEFLAWATGQTVQAVAVVLALRQLARVSRQYTGALLLLVLTLSLATFTASMARTLDESLIHRMYYRTGSDYMLVEAGESPDDQPGVTDDGDGETPTEAVEMGSWIFVPVSEHLRVPGITGATRIGSYMASANIGGNAAPGRFYGIDRMEFPQVAFFRSDFSSSSLGTLMNRLALDKSALLVNPEFMREYQIHSGDRVELTISMYGERRRIPFIVADMVQYFPTYYPDDETGYLFVGNLDYVFEQMGGIFPYDVWVTTEPGIDPEEMRNALAEYDIRVLSMRGSRESIAEEQDRPERTGVFGLLSVGFAAAAVLTLLGFLLHALISFRRRFIEFGVLRAIGLSVGQMVGFLGIEQLLLIVTGTTAGTGLGIWVSDRFIPFLQVGAERYVNIPPFVVLIAWNDIFRIYAVFGIMLVAAIAGMIWFLMHLKIFEAVKLGEAV